MGTGEADCLCRLVRISEFRLGSHPWSSAYQPPLRRALSNLCEPTYRPSLCERNQEKCSREAL